MPKRERDKRYTDSARKRARKNKIMVNMSVYGLEHEHVQMYKQLTDRPRVLSSTNKVLHGSENREKQDEKKNAHTQKAFNAICCLLLKWEYLCTYPLP